nr:hypothetical protein [Tanacetum cinerariifolium]
EKGNEQSSEADDKGFIEVKKKKSGAFKLVSVKPKTHYCFVAKQSIGGTSNSPNTTPSAEMGNKASTMQEEGSTSIVERINVFEKQLMEEKCVLADEDGKPFEKVDYSDVEGSEDDVESVDK